MLLVTRDGMAAGILGRVEEFDRNKEDCLQYIVRLEHFFEANEIKDDSKKQAAIYCRPHDVRG